MAALELPSARSFWVRHERLLLDVFLLALQKLREYSDLPKSEDDISDRLAVAAREATFALGLDYPPKRELPRQPESARGLDATGVGKRPDFTCEVRDTAAANSTEAWLDYHVECKCLGEPSSRTWVFNRNYVDRGIRRFLDPVHGYGERASSGVMIGYVLSMRFEEILEEVNAYLRELWDLGIVPSISFSHTLSGGVAKTDQMLDRARVAPRPFALRHMWVDLRQTAPALVERRASS